MRGHSLVRHAVRDSHSLHIYKNIILYTLERNHTNVLSVKRGMFRKSGPHLPNSTISGIQL